MATNDSNEISFSTNKLQHIFIQLIKTPNTDLNLLKEILNALPNKDLNFGNSYEENPLLSAAYFGEIISVTFLVENGANVNYADSNGKTAVMYAFERGHYSTIRYLLKNGALTSLNGKNMIDYADESHLQIYISLLENCIQEIEELFCLDGLKNKFPQWVIKIKQHLFTLLLEKKMEAARNIVKFIPDINDGKLVECPCCDNGKVDHIILLSYFAYKNDLEIVMFLVEAGADINKISGKNRTPIMYAVEHECLSVFGYLLEKGALLEIKKESGEVVNILQVIPIHANRSFYCNSYKILFKKIIEDSNKIKDGVKVTEINKLLNNFTNDFDKLKNYTK